MKKSLLFFLSFFFGLTIFSQSDSLLQWKFSSKKIQNNFYEISAATAIPAGWQLYGNNNSIDSSISLKLNIDYENAQFVNEMQFNKPAIIATDKLFDNKKTSVYTGDLIITQQIKITGFIPALLKGNISGFIKKGDEFPQVQQSFEVQLEGGTSASDDAKRIKLSTVDIHHPIADCGQKNDIVSKGYLSIFFLGFLGGLIALLTPCVFPMIPVTVSFFTKRSANRKQAIRNGVLYGLFIFLIYVLASIPFHIIGNVQPEIFNNISTNAALNVLFFIIFIFFAISFFGFFEITLPSGIAGKADSKSGLTSVGGIFFMALTLAIVSFSCTGPILGSLLVGSISGGAWQLTSGLAGFGLALALPFAVFAVFPDLLKSLPKSGGWLDTVKKFLAFVELGLAFKFLSNADLVMHWGILKREIFIGIWIIISFALTLYLFGFIRLPHDYKGMKISKGRKFIGVIALLFTLYLVPGIFNKKISIFVSENIYKGDNLQLLSGFPPPFSYSIYKISNGSLEADVVNDFAKALQLSKEQHKPLLIDFTGWACVNCRKMEENVWTKPEVYNYIKQNFILVSLYVDDRKLLPAEQRFTYTTNAGAKKDIVNEGDKWATFQSENFIQSTQPLYVILDNDEKLINNPVGYTPDADEYLKWLQCGKTNFILSK
jgi:thiol:disulfide interchange protein DsbD